MHILKGQVRFIYFVVDVVLICFSFYWPYKFNPDLVPHNITGIRLYLSVYLFWGVALILFIKSALLYYTNRYLSISEEWLKVGKCILFSTFLTVLFIYILKVDIFSRSVFIETAIALLLTISLWRATKRIFVRYLIQKNGYANYNVLIVGVEKAGLDLAEEIKSFPYLGLNIVGFLDDRVTGEKEGVKILGKVSDFEQVVKKYFVDEIYVATISDNKIVGEIIKKGIKLGRTVRVAVDDFDLVQRQVKLSHIGVFPLIVYSEEIGHGANGLLKRSFDIISSGFVLIFLLPLFAIVVLLIKLESCGPVFYISKRSGKRGVIFDFYKFRSMIKDAHKHKEGLKDESEVDGPIFKIKKDPRLTNLGRFLRKYSIDELPQLINVLKGDMSLVGPRPFPVEESNKIEYKHIPRLNIKPGITGLAQIKGRSDLKFNNWMRWDAWYVANWSFGLDIKIILWTIPAVLKGKGAY